MLFGSRDTKFVPVGYSLEDRVEQLWEVLVMYYKAWRITVYKWFYTSRDGRIHPP